MLKQGYELKTALSVKCWLVLQLPELANADHKAVIIQLNFVSLAQGWDQ